MRDKFLPIGSVVLLDGGTKKLMITGFCPVVGVKIYDYCGCLYPEGIISSDQNCVFEHSQIKDIVFVGHESIEEVQFRDTLNNYLESINYE